MPVQCPSCKLLFSTSNELDWHTREEHMRPSLPVRTPPPDDVTTPVGRMSGEQFRAGTWHMQLESWLLDLCRMPRSNEAHSLLTSRATSREFSLEEINA